MTRVVLLSFLAGCWGGSSTPTPSEPAPAPQLPVDVESVAADIDTDTRSDTDARPDTDAPPPIRPAFVQVHGTFAIDRDAGVLRPFTLDGAPVPVALDLVIFDADPREDTPPVCGLSLRPKDPAPLVSWLTPELPEGLSPMGHVGLLLQPGAFDVVDHPSEPAGLPGCLQLAATRGWAPEPWGADPLRTLSRSSWGIYLGPLPDALQMQLPETGAYRRGVGLAGTLVTDKLGQATLAEATARRVDADFAVQAGPTGEPQALRTIMMSPVPPDQLPSTGAYRVFDPDQVFPAQAVAGQE